MGKVGVAKILTKSIPFRKEFNLAVKEAGETPKEWLARVKALSEMCGFGQAQNMRILDKFVTGFDTEIINHLCSTAKHLDIRTALEITEAYSMREKSNGIEAIFMHDQEEQAEPEACKLVEQNKPAISEILVVKCEDLDINDGGNKECQGENDLFNEFNDNTFDDGAADNNNSDSTSNSNSDSDQDAKDSDFRLSDYDSMSRKYSKSATEELRRERERVKRKYMKKADKEKMLQDIKPDITKITDLNAPKKRRKYKQRPKKEKVLLECDYCHYKVYHKCHLARHMLIHLNQKSFICHECGKGFNMFLNLNQHLKRHAGYKPHVCEVCKASFIDKSRLTLHMRTHTGERPYGCTMCEKRFADRYYLKIHIRSHTGEKPFKCDQCQRTFSQSSSLSLHKRKNCIKLCQVKKEEIAFYF